MPASKLEAWTAEYDAIVRSGVRDGLSSSLIAIQLSKAGRHRTTRNAVIGRRNRIGIAGPKPTQKDKPKYRIQAARTKEQAVKSKPIVEPAPFKFEGLAPHYVWQPLPGSTPVALMALKDNDCRWPVEGGSCGCNKVKGFPYCPTHAAIAFQPPQPRRRPDQYITTIPALGSSAVKAAQEFLKETV